MRRTAFAIGALFFINGAAFASWAPRVPELAARNRLSIAELGLVFLVAGIGGVLATRPTGALLDGVGSRRTAVGGNLLAALLLPLVGVTTDGRLLAAVLFAVAAVDVAGDIGMNAQAMALQGGGTSVINRFHGMWSVGSVVGGLMGAAAAGAGIPVDVHFALVGATLAVASLAAFRELPDATVEPAGDDGEAEPASLTPLVALGALAFVTAFLESPGNEWSATFLTDARGSAPGVAALGFVAFTTGMTISRFGGDAAVERAGVGPAYRGALALSGVGWVVATAVDLEWASIAGLLAAGLGVGTLFPRLYAIGGSGRLVSQGRGLATMSVGMRLGFLATGPVVGLVGEAVGLEVALGVLTLSAVALSLWLSRRVLA